MSEAGHPRRRALAWLIFFISFLIYQSNLRPVASGDTLPTALLPFSILLDKTLDLDRFATVLTANNSPKPYFLIEKNNHFYSIYPLGQPALLTLLYIPVFAILDPASLSSGDLILLARILEKLIAGAIAAASVAFFFVLLDRLTSRRNAIVLSILYGFGATTWAISSQALWQHTGGELLIVLTLLALQRWTQNEATLKFLLLAGVWAALALMVRPTLGLLACVIFGALVLHRTPIRALLVFLAPLLLGGAVSASWNFWLFRNFLGVYGESAINYRIWEGLAGLLFSPARGLLIYCPFFLFAVWGVWRSNRRNDGGLTWLLLSISVVYCLLHLIMVSFSATWWGGQCWGPRYLTEIIPCLTLLMLPAMDSLMASRWQRTTLALLAIFSIGVQFVGVYYYPKGLWDLTPLSADEHPERFWDWADPPIKRTAQGGLQSEPHKIALEGLLHGKDAALRKMREAGYKGF